MITEFDNDSDGFEENLSVQPAAPERPDPRADVEKKEFSKDGATPSEKKTRSPKKELKSELLSDDLSGGFTNSVSFADMGIRDAFRDLDENDFIDDLNYTKPRNLNAPEPRPGFDQRFCQLELHGKTDPKGVAKMQAGRWTLRKFTKHEVQGFPAVIARDQPGVYVVVGSKGGSYLCERPVAISHAIRKRNLALANRYEGETKNKLMDEAKQGNVNIPVYQDTTEVKRGFKPVVAPNTGH